MNDLGNLLQSAAYLSEYADLSLRGTRAHGEHMQASESLRRAHYVLSRVAPETAKERVTVLQDAANGVKRSVTAASLGVHVATVNRWRRDWEKELEARTITQAVAVGIRSRIIT